MIMKINKCPSHKMVEFQNEIREKEKRTGKKRTEKKVTLKFNTLLTLTIIKLIKPKPLLLNIEAQIEERKIIEKINLFAQKEQELGVE